MKELTIIGGGLAGCEAAWQGAVRGVKVVLYEMRPDRLTEAHRTGLLAELVCSNSLRSAEITSAPGLLKEELRLAGSLVMEAAERSRIPAGSAFAVDRTLFAGFITEAITGHSNIRVIRKEVQSVPDAPCVVSTGPLTSPSMADALGRITGREYLYFYDAIAPIVSADSIDMGRVFLASRYGKGGDDYVNCPMTREEYGVFYEALVEADRVQAREFEDAGVFEGCMPVEVMAMRGRDTLRFGPMKPVGLPDPVTGREPYAVVQLRAENSARTAYNLVGFQTRLKWPEQGRVFRMIPGLGSAEFLRFGSVHRNTFVNAPLFLGRDLAFLSRQDAFLAGQITGVEGYIESTAMGLIAGINAARMLRGESPAEAPPEAAHGALLTHISTQAKDFQPSNINFGLFPPLGSSVRDKAGKKRVLAARALGAWGEYLRRVL